MRKLTHQIKVTIATIEAAANNCHMGTVKFSNQGKQGLGPTKTDAGSTNNASTLMKDAIIGGAIKGSTNDNAGQIDSQATSGHITKNHAALGLHFNLAFKLHVLHALCIPSKSLYNPGHITEFWAA